jgi:hypothetical protein
MTFRLDDIFPCLNQFNNERIKNTNGKDKIVFSFKTQLRFGRYSPPKDSKNRSSIVSSIIADVWKFDAEYIQWLILNANGFSILPNTLDVLLNTPIFNHDDLENHLLVEEEADVYSLDFKKFYTEGNFKFHKEVKETLFPISNSDKENLKQVNLEKIENNILDCATACKGSLDWGVKAPIKYEKRKHILLKR